MKLTQMLPIAISLYLLTSIISISASQLFLSFALIFWIILLIKEKKPPSFPSFFWPLLVYAGISLIASFLSRNPETSLKDSRELLLFLVVPIAYTGFRIEKEIKRANLALLASACLSMGFSFVYFILKAAPGERIKGFMGHYMTQAGLLLLFSAVALSITVFSRDKTRIFWGIGFGLALAALLLTLTRNAWIGLIVAVGVIIYLYKPKVLIALPLVVGLLFAISPGQVKKRALSTFSTKAFSNRQRIEYIHAGIKIIKDYPLFGTGPNTVDVVFQYPKYGLSEEAKKNVHLHNNFVQIAAERGIPALFSWLAFLIWIFFSLIKLLKNKDPAIFSLAAGALAALLAIIAAGFFEYNFGDSEVTTLFLYLMTIPFTLERLRKAPVMNPIINKE
ncbi:MAG: O-antigen ligase family protein [Candidatus Aminicenantes bacterium]|nr:O-antigen ligase family protein [Candidatus Aminicenantes bacterium]